MSTREDGWYWVRVIKYDCEEPIVLEWCNQDYWQYYDEALEDADIEVLSSMLEPPIGYKQYG